MDDASPHRLGPGCAELRVLTHRAGLAQKAGHDLVLVVGRWEAALTLGDAPALELSADSRSLEVRSGSGGVKALTDKDRRDILKNVDTKVLQGEPIRFRSTAVTAAEEGRLDVTGDLTLAGTTRPVTFELHVGAEGTVRGRATVTQTAWGVKPYSGLMGALKVADDVEIELEGRLPLTVTWQPGEGPLGPLAPLIGAWVAEGETATGTYRCERRFDRVLHASHVQCVVTWILPGRDHEELAVFGAGRAGEVLMWSFTSDGRQSTGRLSPAHDLPEPNVAFVAEMPSGLARFAYWPEPGGLRFVVEAQAGGGWTRFLEHQYVPLD